MNFRKARFREEPEINLIPMIDVLLVILIFLMITTTYSRYTELKINLPTAQADKSKALPNTIEVAIDSQGHYLIDRKVIPFVGVSALAQQMKRAAGENRDPVVVISADAQAAHQSVINVMSAAREAGYSHITFTAETPQ
jgi:biopolymer transport protein ExbD